MGTVLHQRATELGENSPVGLQPVAPLHQPHDRQGVAAHGLREQMAQRSADLLRLVAEVGPQNAALRPGSLRVAPGRHRELLPSEQRAIALEWEGPGLEVLLLTRKDRDLASALANQLQHGCPHPWSPVCRCCGIRHTR